MQQVSKCLQSLEAGDWRLAVSEATFVKVDVDDVDMVEVKSGPGLLFPPVALALAR